jgi:hypothetical protein
MIKIVKLCEQNPSLIGQVRTDWQSSVCSLLGSMLSGLYRRVRAVRAEALDAAR